MNHHNQAPKLALTLLMPVIFLIDSNPAAAALQRMNSLIHMIPLLLVSVIILLALTGLVYVQQRLLHKNR